MPIIGEWLSIEILHGVPTDDLIHYSVLKVKESRITYHCPKVSQFIISNFWSNAFTICQSYIKWFSVKILHRVPNEDLIHYSVLKVHQTKLANNFPVVRHFIIRNSLFVERFYDMPICWWFSVDFSHEVPNEDSLHYLLLTISQNRLANHCLMVRHLIISNFLLGDFKTFLSFFKLFIVKYSYGVTNEDLTHDTRAIDHQTIFANRSILLFLVLVGRVYLATFQILLGYCLE